MSIVYALIAVFFVQNVLLGALYGRMDGGGGPKTPEIVERSLILFYFIMACLPFAGWYSPLAFAGIAGIATGHGLYFLARSVKATTPEFFDFIVRAFFGEDPRTSRQFEHLRGIAPEKLSPDQSAAIKSAMDKYGMTKLYWRCVFGMAVTGSMVGLPAAILALYFGAYWQAALFALTGPIKAFSYAVTWHLFKDTAPAEWLNGGLRTAAALAALLIGTAALLQAVSHGF